MHQKFTPIKTHSTSAHTHHSSANEVDSRRQVGKHRRVALQRIEVGRSETALGVVVVICGRKERRKASMVTVSVGLRKTKEEYICRFGALKHN